MDWFGGLGRSRVSIKAGTWPRAVQWAYGAVVLAVFALAVAPVKDSAIPISDKLNHFAAFYVLGLFGGLAFPRCALWKLALALSAYGGAIEIIQGLPFVGRDCDALDWVTDCVAVACATLPLALSGLRRRGAADKPTT